MIGDRTDSIPATDDAQPKGVAPSVQFGVTGAAVFLVARKVGLHADISETMPGAPFPVPKRNSADDVQFLFADWNGSALPIAFRFTEGYHPW